MLVKSECLHAIRSLGECKLLFLQRISTGSRAVVAVSLGVLPTATHDVLLAMGGLDNNIRLFCGGRLGQVRHLIIIQPFVMFLMLFYSLGNLLIESLFQ